MVFYLFDLFINVLKAGILWLLVVVVLCICRMFIRKGREAKSLNCGLLWCTLSFLLPGYAKRHDIISKKWKRCLAVLVSPACLLTVVTPVVLFFHMDLPAKCGFLGDVGEGLSRRMISMHTGVDFPGLDYVETKSYDAYPDFTNETTMQLRENTTEEFVEELKNSDKWRQDSNNPQRFVFVRDDFKDDFMTWSESVSVDVKTCVVTLSYMTL